MPSGAKKRKAAKKKDKGGSSTTNNPSSTATSANNNRADPHGDEHLKQHEINGAEFSDHHNSEQNLTDGEEEVGKKKDEDSRLEEYKAVDDVSSVNGAAAEEGGIQIERIMKQEDKFDKKGGSSISGSSSSSDDESHAVEKDVEVADNAPVVDSVDLVDSNKEEQIQVNLSSPVSKFENCAEEVSVLVEKVSEDLASPAFSSYEEDQKDNGERKSSSFEANGRLPDTTEDVPPDVKEDLPSENNKKEVINVAAISDTKEYAAFESEEKVAPSYNAPDYAVKDAEHVKDSNDLRSSGKQPLVASAVPPVQRTSWKGCCGLFELFTGSDA